ncbi:MAG: acyl carrier protein phosphodiesterase [Spirosomaceae bacterium]|nr:acyl carrier protein phosphodiesterase [Spirosomataceae bacterium]
MPKSILEAQTYELVERQMNYLAHLFLSGDEEEVIVGNMMEDFIVGTIEHPRNQHLSERIKVGIELHRLIDVFMDTHDSVKSCKSVLYPKYHKYSSVIIDVFFDHFLAKYWEKYTKEDFKYFRGRIYEAFENHWEILPKPMQPTIESMIHHDWLKNYSEFWGIERALQNVSKRAKHDSGMENAVVDLKQNYELIQRSFEDFFPKMMNECSNFLKLKVKNG